MCWEPWLSCSDCCFSMFCCVAVLIAMLSFGSWCSFWFTELSSYFHFLKESIFGLVVVAVTRPNLQLTVCCQDSSTHKQSQLHFLRCTDLRKLWQVCLLTIVCMIYTQCCKPEKQWCNPKLGDLWSYIFHLAATYLVQPYQLFYINIVSFLLKHTAATHCLQKEKKQRMPGSKGVHRGKGNVDKGGVWDIGYGFSSFWWHEQNHFIIGWEGKVIQIATGQKLDHLPMWMPSLSQFSLTRPRTCRRSKLFLCKHVS